jgi:folate-binding protein YgfZ
VALLNEDVVTVFQPDSAENRDREYAAVSSKAGMRLLDDRILVRITGDDRVSFLHGMCTADLKGLQADAVAKGLFLTEHAHVIADFFAYGTTENAILLEMDRAAWPRARAHLEKFLVADDVEMEEAAESGILDVEGPESGSLVKSAIGVDQMPAAGRQTVFEGVRMANLARNGGPAFTIIAERARLADLVEKLGRQGVSMVGPNALETIRIEHGIARVGVDTGEKTIALEARLEPAISFNKGCYVGQETVERATAHGSLKKRLLGLRISGKQMPATNAPVLFEGKEVGRLSSVVFSPRLGIIGLAIVHHSAWTAGLNVVIVDGADKASAMISDLPIQ